MDWLYNYPVLITWGEKSSELRIEIFEGLKKAGVDIPALGQLLRLKS